MCLLRIRMKIEILFIVCKKDNLVSVCVSRFTVNVNGNQTVISGNQSVKEGNSTVLFMFNGKINVRIN